ncbi:MAG: molybdopterin-dependent oxidoreductase [Syntrophomonas sp.]
MTKGRFKTGILLLVFIMLLGISGCGEEGDKKNESLKPENSSAQMPKEKPAAEKNTQNIQVEKPVVGTGEDKDNGAVDNKPPVNSAKKDAAATSPAKEAQATKQASPAKISISGTGIKTALKFTLDELKQMEDITISDRYFSRGTQKPGWAKTAHTDFTGVLLYELLADHAGLTAKANRVKIIAEDDYTQVFSIEEIKADYIDETDNGKKLRMIIAWSQDGKEYDPGQGAPFRLVMGQQFAEDYNRMKWVDHIASIVVE